MDAKTAFLDQIIEDLPDGIKDHLETPIPAFVATPVSYDPDHPTRNNEILAHNLNEVGRAFEGLTLAAVPMYIAQLNTVNQGMLLSALEFIGAQGEIAIIAPVNGGVYYGAFLTWKAELIRGAVESIKGYEGEDEFEFEEVEEKLFSAEWPIAIGRHSAKIIGYFSGGSSTEEVLFEVKSYDQIPSVPQDGDEIQGPLEEIKLLTGMSTDDITEEITAKIDDGAPFSFTKVSALGFNATVSVQPDGQIHTIEFFIGTESFRIISVLLSQ